MPAIQLSAYPRGPSGPLRLPMDRLQQIIRTRLDRTAPTPVAALSDEMRRRFGDSVLGVLFYGSCLRQGDALEGIADLYVIVSDYARAYPRWRSRMLARVLPPTVGYLELPIEPAGGGEGDDAEGGGPATVVRAKYAVISLGDFRKGTSARWFHSYLWGRFSQPCLLAWARDAESGDAVADCLAQAAGTLISRSLPLLPTGADAVTLWSHALDLSYGTELRPESKSRARELVEADEDYYRELLAQFAGRLSGLRPADDGGFHVSTSRSRRMLAAAAWRTRRVTGKLMSTARWLKALGTFEGGLDYAAWKLERHSGVKVHVTDKMRRRPWLYVWGELIRLYRRGVLR